jgi:hypothetical protein
MSQPTERHLTVREYVTPEKFQFWKEYGESVGFRYVASGPLVSDPYSGYSLFPPLYMANDKYSKTIRVCICHLSEPNGNGTIMRIRDSAEQYIFDLPILKNTQEHSL